MPKNADIKKVLVIGSGPIVIGQAAEFDYAGTQACRALAEDGIEVVLVNSNPATIMTDNAMANKIYIEPLSLVTIKRIIEKERPDSVLSTLGGQTGLTLCMQLAKEGFLHRHNVKLLGASLDTIDKAEDRKIFKETMQSINQPCIPSSIVHTPEQAIEFALQIGYPVIVRPSFTLGGSGGGIAYNQDELCKLAQNGLYLSPINQILVEKSVAGWKEIEFELVRDESGNVVTVCSMENLDPVGIHTGDSIVVAPAVTLADREFQMLRTAAINIVHALGIQGACNCQFALDPLSMDYAVIEVNPRVSRSSALASKATGYPIAKVATKIALGYRLDEIVNTVTGKTYAAVEPCIDYFALKFPKWAYDKFVYAKRDLGTQMKATGEVMAIGDTFESALLKAIRGAEIGTQTLSLPHLAEYSQGKLLSIIKNATDERLFAIYEAISRGVSLQEIHELSKIDMWFLHKIYGLYGYCQSIKNTKLSREKYVLGKRLGFTDQALSQLSQSKIPLTLSPSYKMVDTCAGEFSAVTPYFYSVYHEQETAHENEAQKFLHKSDKQTVVVFGSGPIRIGQGIEFDYACVHCVWALKKLGYEVVIINNNPETVSTDFDTADRLYFEPLNIEDVLHILDLEQPVGVVVAFGGQTAIKLTKQLAQRGISIIGTSADSIDCAEDRERFEALLEELGINRPKGFTVQNVEQALQAAHTLSYPVLMRPSYVLGGQNMIIAFSDADITEYMGIILRQSQDSPVLIDKYLSGLEIEVDAICDGQDILIPGIMEHIERTGIHSGDSCAVYPAGHIDDALAERITQVTQKICTRLNAVGLINLQYIIYNNEIYVIEVNPRASRTVPYISKVTKIPMCELAIRAALGEKLVDMGYGTGLYKASNYTAVKVPVFSFEKLIDVDTHLGPEMKSTGEVLGIGKNLSEALCKGLIAAGYKLAKNGGVFLTVRDSDKDEIVDIAKKFHMLGFTLFATQGTADVLHSNGLTANVVNKISEDPAFNSKTLLESKRVNYIISTSAGGRDPARDDVKIRRTAVALGIPCLTSLDTANAIADSLTSRYGEFNTELVDINDLREKRMHLEFTKMQGAGNDYIYIDCFKQNIIAPESLAVALSDRRFGIGSDGLILICPSNVADAKMRMFNSDGSEGKMCGNAIRCVAKFLYDNGMVKKRNMDIETLSGIKHIQVITKNNVVSGAIVDMGKASLQVSALPALLDAETAINYPLEVGTKTFNVTCVSMGNPHCVLFVKSTDNAEVEKIGKLIETHAAFPERVNVEFVQIVDKNTIKMRVWERGSGETLACGTGACAAVVAAVQNGHCHKNTDIRVILLGGELVINYNDDRVLMTGAADKIFDGTIEA